MSATALRPTEITARTLESRQLDAPAEIAGRFFGPRVTGRYLSSRYLEPASKYFELADRMWLTEIEDAAALLDLEDKLYLVEIEARALRTA